LQRLLGATAQGFQAVFGPRLDPIEAMVGLGEQMDQPDQGGPAQGQALSIAMHDEVLIQQVREIHLLHLRHQQRNIIDPFGGNGKCIGHAESLPESPNFVEK
jgi:hypothetical protein